MYCGYNCTVCTADRLYALLLHSALCEAFECWVARVTAEIAVSRPEKLLRMRRDAGYCRVVAMG